MKKGTISFAIATRRVKCLVMNLTKDVKNLHTKNYKVLLKEIVKDTIKQKDILFSQLKYPHYLKQNTDLMHSP